MQSIEKGAQDAQQNKPKEFDLMSSILEGRKTKTKANSEVTVIDAKTFFIDDQNLNGAMFKSTLEDLFDNAPGPLLKEMELVLQRLNEQEPIAFKAIKYGQGDYKHYYVTIPRKQGNEPLRMPAVDNVAIFMLRYMDKRIRCEFTMKELYDIVKG